MLKNLQDALRKKGVTNRAYAEFLGISEKTLNNKLKGKNDFLYRQVLKTHSILFPEYRIEYLFEDDSSVPPHKTA